MRTRGSAVVLVCTLAFLAVAQGAQEATPPTRGDPCARNARNVCGTTGVGYYKVGRYGQRWYGDFRGAVAGVAHAYCIDLRFWYPSAAYRYKEDTSGALVNKDGESVSALHRQLIAYAIARYGQTTNPDQAAAVMLYVHSLIGDARPGELDANDVSPTVKSLFSRVARDSEAYHGPYRIDFRLTGALTVGKRATANVRVLSASGNPMPDVALTITGDGVATRAARTSVTGGTTMAFTPPSASPRLTIRATGLPSTFPRVFRPTTASAAANGQRLVVAATQEVSASLRTAASKRQIGVTTTATPATLGVGEASMDKVSITGAAPDWRATVSVRLYGPFQSLAQARCDGTPAWQSTFTTNGPGTYTTPSATLAKAGWYTYVEVVPSDLAHVGLTTACGVAAESLRVQAVPKVSTNVSSQRVTVGSSITDRIHVEGLGGAAAVVEAALYGPFPSKDNLSCDGTPVWTGSVSVSADGDYDTAAYTTTQAGYYTYHERIADSDLVRGVETTCGDVAETTVAVAHPLLTTKVSTQEATPGASVTDAITVTGLQNVATAVQVELWGPFTAASAIRCTGTPLRVLTLPVAADGSFNTPPVVLSTAGVYTFRASIPAGPLNDAYTAPCGEAPETVTVETPPPPKTPKVFVPTSLSVTTVASHEVVRPGSMIFDRIKVRGVRGLVQVELFGPFATRAEISCAGRPVWTRQIMVRSDGTVLSPQVRILRAGFYGFRERVLRPGGATQLVTACGIQVETALGAPLIVTGRGDEPRYVPAPGVGALTPTRVRLRSVGIDAPVSPVGVDVIGGVLGVPRHISRTGWWRDGSRPTDGNGVVLIAGHVDSKVDGRGAFYKLGRARIGDVVDLETLRGGTIEYRVVSIRNYPKRALPTSVWSRKGAPRLVLVTCGGPFNRATGHYRDNVVITAAPS